MLKGKCIHPLIMKAISACGHGDRILISDGNYPLASKSGEAEKIYLGVMRDLPTVTDVLQALKTEINVEKAVVMDPCDGSTPEIFGEFIKILDGIELEKEERFQFYESCQKPDVRIAISTGESRTFANILLTVGVA